MSTSDTQHDDATPDLAGRFDQALEQVSQASRFAKALHTGKVLQLAGRLLCQPEGAEQLYQRATAIEHSGLFSGTDWANPEILQADITVQTLRLGAPGGWRAALAPWAAARHGRQTGSCSPDLGWSPQQQQF